MRATHQVALAAAAAAMLASAAGVATATPVPQSTPHSVPTGFLAQSTSWLSKQAGWVLGAAPCGKKTCSDVIGTSDGGTSWSKLGQVHAPIAQLGRPRHPGVTELRFGTANAGWAFAPLLRHTSDGGHTWTLVDIPGDGGQVLDLATTSKGSWAIVSACAWAHSRGPCKKQPLTVWRTTTATGTTWTDTGLTVPYNYYADIAAYGNTVYVVDEQLEYGQPDVLDVSTDGGKTFESRTAPCSHDKDLALTQAVPTSATKVGLLCNGDPGFSKAVKIVYTSNDTAKADRSRGQTGLYGISAQLAVSPSGKLAVASWSDGSFIYINTGHKRVWSMPVGLGDGGLGWNDIQYVTNTDAYVVYSPANGYDPQGQLWVTHDAGRDWNPVSF